MVPEMGPIGEPRRGGAAWVLIPQLPTRSFARARGYERRAYFQADEAARHASSLDFD